MSCRQTDRQRKTDRLIDKLIDRQTNRNFFPPSAILALFKYSPFEIICKQYTNTKIFSLPEFKNYSSLKKGLEIVWLAAAFSFILLVNLLVKNKKNKEF